MLNQLLLCADTTELYFSQPEKGIFTQQINENGDFSQAETITINAIGPFSVYSTSPHTVHMIYVDKNNNLNYALKLNGVWRHHVMCSLGSEISPAEMRLYTINARLNLLFSAGHDNKIILVHCVLGDRAMPHMIDNLSSPYFRIYNNYVYYTSESGELHRSDLSDEKPVGFEVVNPYGEHASVYNIAGEDVIYYIHKNRLYINKKEVLYDSRMEFPTILSSGDTMYAMWKSGGCIRYITSKNFLKSWSSPMRFMTSGAEIQMYYAINGNETHLVYGYNTNSSLHIFAKPDECKLFQKK